MAGGSKMVVLADIVATAAVDFDDGLNAGQVKRTVREITHAVPALLPDVKRVVVAPTSLAAA